MISLNEFLKGRVKLKDLGEQEQLNVVELLSKINIIRHAYGKPLIVTSGYRSPEYNRQVGGAAKSNHVKAAAIDVKAPHGGEFKRWVLKNLGLFEKLGLYMEDFNYTKTWAHIQIVAPRSRKRFFKP